MPVQIEPIAFSGERITVAIAIAPDAGQPTVVGTLNPEAMEQVFGRYGKHLFLLAGKVIASLQSHLATGGALERWAPELQGVFAGAIVPTRNYSLEAIADSAKANSSLFSAKANGTSVDVPLERESSRFMKSVQGLVTPIRQGLAERFNRKLPLYGDKGQATLGYVGTHLAMNFSAIDPTGTGHPQQRDAVYRKTSQLVTLSERDVLIGHKLDRLTVAVWMPAQKLTRKQSTLLEQYRAELATAAGRSSVELLMAEPGEPLERFSRITAERILADA